MVVQRRKYTKNHWIVHLKRVNFVVCKIHLNSAANLEKKALGGHQICFKKRCLSFKSLMWSTPKSWPGPGWDDRAGGWDGWTRTQEAPPLTSTERPTPPTVIVHLHVPLPQWTPSTCRWRLYRGAFMCLSPNLARGLRHNLASSTWSARDNGH